MTRKGNRSLAQELPSDEGNADARGLLLRPGQLVGHFRVVRLIGQGGMGAVFEAFHPEIERRAAIKVLYPEYAQHPQLLARFLNEARAVNLAHHPGLLEIFDYGRLEDGTPYILMEYLEGEALSDRLERGALLPEILDIARQIAFALAAAHDKGIVHRDLKPDNVILVREPDPPHLERVKVLDFGVAKLAGAAPASALRTATGATLGTPAYMSPEQCLGLVNVDGKADVYALGVILYEMLARRLPFVAEMSFDQMAMHVREEPPPLSSVAPGVPDDIAALTHRMLAKRPAERPAMALAAAELVRREGDESARHKAGPVLPARVATRILVVEDDLDLGAALHLVLAEQGYTCKVLESGEGVEEAVRSLRPHIMLLDVELPGKSGYELCWQIKSEPDLRDTLVVLISAKSRVADQKLGLAMQADAYMTKPFEMENLLALLRLLLDQNDEA